MANRKNETNNTNRQTQDGNKQSQGGNQQAGRGATQGSNSEMSQRGSGRGSALDRDLEEDRE